MSRSLLIAVLLGAIAAYLIVVSVAYSFASHIAQTRKIAVAVTDGFIAAVCIAAALELAQ